MSYVVFCVVETLLLATFVMGSLWMHIARTVQHNRCKRELTDLLEQVGDLKPQLAQLHDLTNVNAAAELLDAAMRKTIAEGIELRQQFDARIADFAALVQARNVQRLAENDALATWIKIRDDITAWAEHYPGYLFQPDGENRGQG